MAAGDGSISVILCRIFLAGSFAAFALGMRQHYEYLPVGAEAGELWERAGVPLDSVPQSRGSAVIKLTRNLQAPVRGSAGAPQGELPLGAARQADWGEAWGRQLQQNTCANDTDVYVSSTAFPDAEGCYLPSGDNIYTSNTLDRVVAAVPVSDVEDAESRWVSGVVDSTSSVTASFSTYVILIEDECFSDNFSTSSHPAELSTWYCYLDGAIDAVEVIEAAFSAACGCTTSSAPTAVPTPTPTTAGDDDISGESSCGDTESFEITAASAPDLEGCYEYTGVGYLYGGYYFNRTGSDYEDVTVFPLAYGSETSARWTLGVDASDTDAIVIYCYSNEAVNETSPAEASWNCNFNGTLNSFDVMSDDTFAVDCGCSSESTATPSPVVGDSLDAEETDDTGRGMRLFSEISVYGTVVTSLVIGIAGVMIGTGVV